MWPPFVLIVAVFAEVDKRGRYRDRRVVVCDCQNGRTTSDADLRWVPPGSSATFYGLKWGYFKIEFIRMILAEKLPSKRSGSSIGDLEGVCVSIEWEPSPSNGSPSLWVGRYRFSFCKTISPLSVEALNSPFLLWLLVGSRSAGSRERGSSWEGLMKAVRPQIFAKVSDEDI